ncbi:MAG: sigma-70 family RNA polymerase sigma factor [Bacteroidia bacterium]
MIEASIIKGCIRNELLSQKKLYELAYNGVLVTCLRYSKTIEEAKDILFEAFLIIFNSIKEFNEKTSFEEWAKQKTVQTAINHLQKNKQNYAIVSTIYVNENKDAIAEFTVNEKELNKPIQKEQVLKALQELVPAYRIVYNLFMIDAYSHQKIAQLLDISEETSKMNLSKAKYNLRKNLMLQIKL